MGGSPILALLTALAATPLRAQYVHGLVVYTHNEQPVGLATVRLISEEGKVLATELTGLDGRFTIPVDSAGSYLIHAEHLTAFASVDGPLTLGPESKAMVVFRLVPQPVALEGLEVEVQGRVPQFVKNGFYHRRESTAGFFMDPAAVEKRRPIRTSDLLRVIPGLRYFDQNGMAGFGGYPVMSYALRTRLLPGMCYPRIYVDGTVIEFGGTHPPSQGFDTIVPATDILAMEVYRSPAETPPEFGGLTGCGVILIWTRMGRN